MTQSAKPFSAQTFADLANIEQTLNPGEWVDKRQVTTSASVVIGGKFLRTKGIKGTLCTTDAHFFDFCLGRRPEGTKGQLIDHFLEPQPLGEVVFVPAGTRYIASTGSGEHTNLLVFLNAKMTDDIIEQDKSPETQQFMDLHNDRVRFLLTQICKELYDPGSASALMIEGLCITLLAETARMLQRNKHVKRAAGGLSPANLRRVIERVTRSGTPPCLQELADLCNLSRRHLMRSFQQSTGQTIGQFIKHKTFERAQILLTKSDLSIGEIASELGFVNTSSFSTAFRRMTGQSPRKFRDQHTPTSIVFH